MRKALLIIGLLLTTTVAEDKPVPGETKDLAWLAGTWMGTAAGKTCEEHWSKPADGTVIGMERQITPGRKRFFSFAAIEQHGATLRLRLIFVYSKGPEEVVYKLTSLGSTSVVFSNPEVRYPKQIKWERAGDALTVTLSNSATSRGVNRYKRVK